jgi:hypothetical protein
MNQFSGVYFGDLHGRRLIGISQALIIIGILDALLYCLPSVRDRSAIQQFCITRCLATDIAGPFGFALHFEALKKKLFLRFVSMLPFDSTKSALRLR